MQWDIRSKLLENRYIPLNSIKNKALKSILNDPKCDYYVKIIKKTLNYTDKNDETVFTTEIEFAIVAVLSGPELIDSFATPLKPFFIRTEQDSDAMNEIFEEMRTDFIDEYPDGDA